jgi:hypothetical protein
MEECGNYLKKMLPGMSSEDINTAASTHIYKCRGCGRNYPIWWVSDEDWRDSFGGISESVIAAALGKTVEEAKATERPIWGLNLCKECFEKLEPNPKYLTIDEYNNEATHRVLRLKRGK